MSINLISIAAVAENGVIGDGNKLPWHYPKDLEHYKQTTMGCPLIMGRVTYETIAPNHDNYLSGRIPHIVVSSQELDTPEEVIVVHSIDEAIEMAEKHGDRDVYVIGGASIYEQFMPEVTRLIITHIPGEYDGDTFFPEWDSNDWSVTNRWDLTNELEVVVYEP